MNDAEAQRLLTGIDGPRPLPAPLRDELVTTLTETTAFTSADAPRPLPDDLRHRLEASLITATARAVPRSLRRRVLAATSRPSPQLLGAVAAVVVLFVAGIVLATQPGGDGADTASSGPKSATSTTAAAVAGPGSGTGDLNELDASGGGSTAASGAPAAPTASGAGTARASRPAASPIEITVTGRDGTDIETGFDAYLATVNAAGGIDGRPLTTIDAGRGVARVNLGSEATTGEGGADVTFDGVWYPASYLHDPKLSLSSPFERQARLAVDRAYPDKTSGRVALYTSTTAPWNTLVGGAFEDELKDRGLTVVKLAFTARAPTYVPGVDAAFLSLSPADVSAWIAGASNAPARGVWAMGSAFDDRLARKAQTLDLRVLSPYRPIDGDEATVLRNALPDRALTVTASHGWVTAKALVELLRRTGGARLGVKDLDALNGWDPLWAPPYETRSGTRDRTPEAIVLVPRDGRFVAQGSFLRDR